MMETVLKVKVDEFLAHKCGRYGAKMGNSGVKHENG